MKIVNLLTVATVATGAYMVAIAPNKKKKNSMEGLLVDYAHRGLHGDSIPENSIPAFEEAVKFGYGIELDVRQSADRTLFIFHDDDLKRMCGVDKKFKETTDAEIESLTLNGTSFGIPRFEDVLSLVDGRVPLLVELKGDLGDKTLCPAVAKVLDKYHGPFCVESFNSFLMGWFKKNRPHIPRGQLYTDLDKSPVPLRVFANSMMINSISRPDFIAYDVKNQGMPLLRLCLRVFDPIRFVWTVRNEEDLKGCRENKKISGVIFEHLLPSEKQGK